MTKKLLFLLAVAGVAVGSAVAAQKPVAKPAVKAACAECPPCPACPDCCE